MATAAAPGVLSIVRQVQADCRWLDFSVGREPSARANVHFTTVLSNTGQLAVVSFGVESLLCTCVSARLSVCECISWVYYVIIFPCCALP